VASRWSRISLEINVDWHEATSFVFSIQVATKSGADACAGRAQSP